MMSRSPPWELFETFLAVMRTGSLSAAARALDTAQPTLRRRIEALEREMGDVLFTRSPAGLIPTAAAQAALPLAEEMGAAAAALLRGGGETGGVVRVTCSEVMGVEVLPPILAGLRRRHPAIAIELVASNRTQDLLRRDADIAVRMVQPGQAMLRAKRLGALEIGLFATPAYLAGRRPVRTVADLADGHDLIAGDSNTALDEALTALGVTSPRAAFALRSDSDLAQLAAIRAGWGIGAAQTRLAGGLCRVLPELGFPLPVWLAFHEDLHAVPRLRTVFQALEAGLRRYLEGG